MKFAIGKLYIFFIFVIGNVFVIGKSTGIFWEWGGIFYGRRFFKGRIP